MEKKRHSKESKLAILKEAEKEGVEVMLCEHGIYPITYYHWRKQYSHSMKNKNFWILLIRLKTSNMPSIRWTSYRY